MIFHKYTKSEAVCQYFFNHYYLFKKNTKHGDKVHLL